MRARAFLVAAAGILLLSRIGSAAETARLRVEVEGLGGFVKSYLPSGDLRKNVLSVLSIWDARSDKNLTERRIRKLHDQAPEEIRRALQPFGYYKPSIDAALRRDGDAWVARYAIDPGPELTFTRVDFSIAGEGAEHPVLRGLVEALPIRQGGVVDHPLWEATKKSFENAAGENGFADGGWSVHKIEVDVDKYTAVATLHFDTGPRFFFGPARFHQDVLDDDIVRGYVTWKEGDPLNLNELLKLQGAMSDSPYFRRVEVEARREEAVDRRVPIDVNLEPAPPRKYTFGLGYGTDTGPRGTVGFELRRINRRGHYAQAEGKLSGIEKSMTTKYLIPGPYPRTDLLAFTLAYASLTPKTSESRTLLLGPSLTRSRGRWRETFSLTFQRQTFTVGVDRGTSYLTIPEANWARVVADDRILTRNGHRLEVDVRGAAKNVLSNASFAQLTTRGKIIRSLGPKTRVLARGEIGVLATSDFRVLPPPVRFFAGGDQSVRGFSFNALGSPDEEGNVIGGRFLRVASVEVDRRILDKWGGISAAVFFDAGNATISFSGPWKQGAGFGLRWRSPVGVVRADMAFAVSEPGRPIKFHLNIGPDL